MNRFCAVIFVAFLAVSLAEPPAISHSYGPPEISSGYSYEPQQSAGTEYFEQHVGHQSSEGLHLDPHLLHKIEHILVQHENQENSGGYRIISAPSHSYGAPQQSYGPPSHWAAARVVGIDFGHLRQSIPVAQYLGKERYAPSYSSGWSSSSGHSSSSSSGWNLGSLSWNAPAKPAAWIEPRAPIIVSSGWTAAAKPSGWAVARPSIKYGAPRW